MVNIEQLKKRVNSDGFGEIQKMYDLNKVDEDFLYTYLQNLHPEYFQKEKEKKPVIKKVQEYDFTKYDKAYDYAFNKYPDLEIEPTGLEMALIDEGFLLNTGKSYNV